MHIGFKVKKSIDIQTFKQAQQKWIEIFELQNINEDFYPKLPHEVQSVLKGEVCLKTGSLIKLIERGRLGLLEYIKPTLEHPDFIIEDVNAYIFAKDINKQDVFFTSVAKNHDDNNQIVVVSNAYKKISTLKNRLNENAKIIYKSKEASNLLAEAFKAERFLQTCTLPEIPDTKILSQKSLKRRKQ